MLISSFIPLQAWIYCALQAENWEERPLYQKQYLFLPMDGATCHAVACLLSLKSTLYILADRGEAKFDTLYWQNYYVGNLKYWWTEREISSAMYELVYWKLVNLGKFLLWSIDNFTIWTTGGLGHCSPIDTVIFIIMKLIIIWTKKTIVYENSALGRTVYTLLWPTCILNVLGTT